MFQVTGLLVVCALIYGSLRTFLDVDLWWHIRFGMDILQSGLVNVPDHYSYLSSDYRWFNQEWLAQAIFAFFYTNFGWTGLVLMKASVVLVIFWLIYHVIAKWDLDFASKLTLILMVAVFLSFVTNGIRPHLFTGLLLAITLIVLRRQPSKRLWILPVLFLPWVNLHGGFIIGIATVGLYAVCQTVLGYINKVSTKEIAFPWLILFACCLATTINPYGFGLPASAISVLYQVSSMRPDIPEWQPIELKSLLGALWALLSALVLVGFGMSPRRNFSCRMLWLAFAVLPMISVRYVAFFGLATVLLVGEELAQLKQKYWPAKTASKTTSKSAALAMAAIYVCMSFGLLFAATDYLKAPRLAPDAPVDLPYVPVAILKKIGAHGNMALDFGWGGFVIWHLAPDVKISLDGRGEFAYSPKVMLVNEVFCEGIGPWDVLIKKFPTDMVLVRTMSPVFNLMKLTPSWDLIYSDETAALFLRSGSEAAQNAHHLLDTSSKDELTVPVF